MLQNTETLLPAEFSVGSYSKKVISVKFQALRLVEGGKRLVLVFGIQISESEAELMDGLVMYRDLENPEHSESQSQHLLLTTLWKYSHYMYCSSVPFSQIPQKSFISR